MPVLVLTVDQRGSRSSADLVAHRVTALADVPTLRPFEQTVGDEFQGVLDDPAALPQVVEELLRDGTWLRPANLPGGVLVEAEAIAARAVRVDGPLQGVEGPALAARLWDLGGWARTARQLIERLDPLQARLDAGDATALADGFVAAAAVLRHLQADPLLPSALVPPRWPGEELRAAQHRFDAAFKAVVRAEHRGDR